MTTTNDDLLAAIHSLHTALEVHIARDEGQWEKISDAENEIKELARDGSKLKTKHAALAAAIATIVGGGLQVILRAI